MWYETACNAGGKLFPWFKAKVDEEFYDYISFTGLNVRGEDARALTYGISALVGLFFGFSAVVAFFLGLPWAYLLIVSLIAPFFFLYYLGNYPKIYAENLRVKAFITMPEMISNMAISLKTVPNLEKAVEFAALKTRGQMGVELRKMLWYTYLRVYVSSDDALTKFGENWKRWSDDFSAAIYLMKSSLLEKNEEKRLEAIDRSVNLMLTGTMDKMDVFARSLSMPTLSLYFIGMILPLIMIAVLPALSYVGGSIGVKSMFLVYNVFLPLLVLVWSRRILSKRPSTFLPPEIPNSHPDIPPAGAVKCGRFLFSGKIIILLGFVICIPGIASLFKIGNTGQFTFICFDLTIFLIWGISAGLSAYLLGTTYYQNIIRERIKEMEVEFVEALAQLEGRVSEGRPIEDAFFYVGNIMKGSKIGDVFRSTGNNLLLSRKTLHSALFDQDDGSLKFVYSNTIRNIMAMIVESAEKGNRVTSEMIFRTREHLSKLYEMDKNIEKKLDDVVSSLRSTILFFGPFMAGVVVTLQKMINSKLSEIKIGKFSGINEYSTPFGMNLGLDTFETVSIPAGILQLIVGVYIIEMVIIFSLFISELYAGDDKIFKRMEVGKNLLISVILFSAAIAVSQAFLG